MGRPFAVKCHICEHARVLTLLFAQIQRISNKDEFAATAKGLLYLAPKCHARRMRRLSAANIDAGCGTQSRKRLPPGKVTRWASRGAIAKQVSSRVYPR